MARFQITEKDPDEVSRDRRRAAKERKLNRDHRRKEKAAERITSWEEPDETEDFG